MSDTNRSEFIASLKVMERPKWEHPSRCKRPPVKPPRVPLLLRLLALVGL